MERSRATFARGQLLDLRGKKKILEPARRVGMRRCREYRARGGDEWRSLLRVDDLHGAFRVDFDEHVVFVAVDHDDALPAGDALGRRRRRLQLQDALLGEFLQVIPAEKLDDREGAGEARAAVARM